MDRLRPIEKRSENASNSRPELIRHDSGQVSIGFCQQAGISTELADNVRNIQSAVQYSILYSKAVDVVVTQNLNIVVRLGGLHTLMNFVGAIGYMMRGSGLESALEYIFGKNTGEHILTG